MVGNGNIKMYMSSKVPIELDTTPQYSMKTFVPTTRAKNSSQVSPAWGVAKYEQRAMLNAYNTNVIVIPTHIAIRISRETVKS